MPACAEPKVDGGWSNYGPCSGGACGGSGTKTRTCTDPAPSGGGAGCIGSNTTACTMPACPVTQTVIPIVGPPTLRDIWFDPDRVYVGLYMPSEGTSNIKHFLIDFVGSNTVNHKLIVSGGNQLILDSTIGQAPNRWISLRTVNTNGIEGPQSVYNILTSNETPKPYINQA